MNTHNPVDLFIQQKNNNVIYMCHLVGFVKRYALHRFFLCPQKTVVVSTIFTIVKKFVDCSIKVSLLTVIESLKVTKIYSEVSSNICLLSLDYQDMFADSVFVHTSFDVLIAVVSLNSCAVRYC